MIANEKQVIRWIWGHEESPGASGGQKEKGRSEGENMEIKGGEQGLK